MKKVGELHPKTGEVHRATGQVKGMARAASHISRKLQPLHEQPRSSRLSLIGKIKLRRTIANESLPYQPSYGFRSGLKRFLVRPVAIAATMVGLAFLLSLPVSAQKRAEKDTIMPPPHSLVIKKPQGDMSLKGGVFTFQYSYFELDARKYFKAVNRNPATSDNNILMRIPVNHGAGVDAAFYICKYGALYVRSDSKGFHVVQYFSTDEIILNSRTAAYSKDGQTLFIATKANLLAINIANPSGQQGSATFGYPSPFGQTPSLQVDGDSVTVSGGGASVTFSSKPPYCGMAPMSNNEYEVF